MRAWAARLGIALRRERQRRALTQEALALRARVARTLVSRIETGRANVTFDTLGRLIVGLGVDWAMFMRSLGESEAPTRAEGGLVVPESVRVEMCAHLKAVHRRLRCTNAPRGMSSRRR